MKLLALLLCDGVNFTADGKVNILGGGVDTIGTLNAYPIDINFTAFCRVAVTPGEVGSHDFEFRFMDPDGKDIVPKLEGKLEVQPGATSAQIALVLQGVKIPAAGDYGIEVLVDRQSLASAPFRAMPPGPPPVRH